MKKGARNLFSPRRIAQHHWQSIPEQLRRRVHVGQYLVAFVVTVPFVMGWANFTESGTAGLAAVALALAAILFGLAIQLFGMTAIEGPPADLRVRKERIQNATLLRGLIANVLYCTLWASAAGVLAGTGAFVGWVWPQRILVGSAAGTLVIAVAGFLLTARRLFEVADLRLKAALDAPVPPPPVRQVLPNDQPAE